MAETKTLPKTGILLKMNKGRGLDSGAVLDTISEDWSTLQTALNSLPEDDQAAIKEHFNTCIEDYDEIGDTLFGELEDFSAIVENMGNS